MLRRILFLFTATALLVLSRGVSHVHAASGADLAVTMTANAGSAQVGQDITYTIVATNNGPATVSDYYIRDILPSNLAVVGEDCGGPSADGTWCEYANPSWSLAQGQSKTMTLVARVTAASPNPAVNEGCAGIFSGATDPNSSNNCASVSVSIVSQDTQTCPPRGCGEPPLRADPSHRGTTSPPRHHGRHHA
jgi:uncharacterized repeat protein (TIGR01451 family)